MAKRSRGSRKGGRRFRKRSRTFRRSRRGAKSIPRNPRYSAGFQLKLSRVIPINTYGTTYPIAGNINPFFTAPYNNTALPVQGALFFTIQHIIPSDTLTAMNILYEWVKFKAIKVTYLNDDFNSTTTKSAPTVDVPVLSMVCRSDTSDSAIESGAEILGHPRKKILKISSSMKNPSMIFKPIAQITGQSISAPYAQQPKPLWWNLGQLVNTSATAVPPFYGFKYATNLTSQTVATENYTALMFTFYFSFKSRNSDLTL